MLIAEIGLAFLLGHVMHESAALRVRAFALSSPSLTQSSFVWEINHSIINATSMATELTVQAERAFQKQPHIFLNSKAKSTKKRVGKGGRRWYKDVGLGFRTPKTAIEGTYIGML